MLKQFAKSVFCLVVISLTIPAMGHLAFAQASLPPAVSPWMQMLNRRDSKDLDNYNRLVKPQQDMMKAYSDQQSQLQAQQRALKAMQSGGGNGAGSGSTSTRDLLTSDGSSSGRPTSAANNMLLSPPREIPSTQRNPAVFNQYLHYYPPQAMPRRPVPQFSPTGGRR